MTITHKNHYVPKWYQRRFMFSGQREYSLLDVSPAVSYLKNGKQIKKNNIQEKGPKRFFFYKDLYTTKIFGEENDEIEKYLFGKIDSTGAKALKALVSPNWAKELHPYFISVFEYMDAQKIRTPKGLAWIKGMLKSRNQIELMLQMQKIRKLNCTTWCEGVLEIVCASSSLTKFIVSDNPVTTYNPECYPMSKHCKFPNEPSIFFKGTRTIFPLDLNHCFILTNLEYAKKQGKQRALQNRTNPRFFDNTLARYDTIIRKRSVSEKQVNQINYILKKRSQKYIAAADPEWLFPEKNLTTTNWRSFDKTLLPPKSGLFGFGGEVFIGGKDGKLIMTQDEYGRKPTNKDEWEQKEREVERMQFLLKKVLKRKK